MVHAIRLHETGGPEVMRWETVDPGPPGPGQVRVRHAAVGLNYIDIYFRTGLYPMPLPGGIGLEAAGTVVAVGAEVDEVRLGDRVSYAGGPPGAYAEERCIPAHRLVPLPDDIGDREAAALMLQGMTVQYLLRRTFRVTSDHTILIHAAAGGVGLIACQWAHHLGATVIGTVGSPEKAALAQRHGCHHTILYRQEDVVARVRELTNGAGVPVVYDSVGQATFERSLDCLAPLGTLVLFGQSSGPVPPFDLSQLAAKGSLYITRPTLMTYAASRADLLATAGELLDMVRHGVVTPQIAQTFPLHEAAAAHRALEARETTGSTILIP